jgi:hypothetical protein
LVEFELEDMEEGRKKNRKRGFESEDEQMK